jgi:hypothetical protein
VELTAVTQGLFTEHPPVAEITIKVGFYAHEILATGLDSKCQAIINESAEALVSQKLFGLLQRWNGVERATYFGQVGHLMGGSPFPKRGKETNGRPQRPVTTLPKSQTLSQSQTDEMTASPVMEYGQDTLTSSSLRLVHATPVEVRRTASPISFCHNSSPPEGSVYTVKSHHEAYHNLNSRLDILNFRGRTASYPLLATWKKKTKNIISPPRAHESLNQIFQPLLSSKV